MRKHKVNKRLSIILFFICMATLVITDLIVKPFSKAEEENKARTTGSVFYEGNGTTDSPYVISTAEELQTLAEKVNTYSEDTENGGYYKNKYYILNNDIDFSGKTWTPIGTYDSLKLEDCTTKYSFQGNFNGNGYTIKNISYDITKSPVNRGTYGLFGMLWGDGTNNASVYNLTIDNMTVNLKINGEVNREISIGAIAGQLGKNASIRNCIIKNTNIVVNPEDSNTLYELASTKKLAIGGVVGDTASNASGDSSAWERFSVTDDYGIENCFVDVNITVHDETIKVSETKSKWVQDNSTGGTRYNRYTLGGIVGTICYADKLPQNCVYTGTITATKPFIGTVYGKGEFTSLVRGNYAKLFAADGIKDSTNTNYYYNYKVVNSELTPSEYSFDGEYENNVNVNGIEVHPITSNSTLMAYVQGVNRGNYTSNLGNVLSNTLNTLSKNDSKYRTMVYDSLNNTITFEDKAEVSIQRNNYEFTANLTNPPEDAEKISYKWSILDVAEEKWQILKETSNTINITQDIVDRKLKVEVYSNEELLCSNIIAIEKENVNVWLERKNENDTSILVVNVNASNGDTIDNFRYEWFFKKSEGEEYSKIENANEYIYRCENVPEGAYIKVVVYSTTFEKFKQELEFVNSNAIFVDKTNGKNSNDGKTKETAVQTLNKAYELLPSDKEAKNNIIVIVGKYDGWLDTYQLAGSSYVFVKPATICGKYLGVDYEGTLQINQHTYLNANTIMKDITLTASGNTFLYTQENDLTMEESVIFGDGFEMAYNTASTWGISDIDGYTNLKRISIVGGTRDYHRDKYGEVKQRICNIIIRCNGIAVITGGARTQGDNNADVYGTLENPANVKITIDIKNSSKTLDLGLLVGGQCDSSSFINTEINVENGKIARIVGGTLGYGNPLVGVPKDTFYGSTILNINGGTIAEIYGGALGRNDKTSYMYGRVDLNINGGTINGNVYGAGAGGTFGYSANYVDRMTDDFKSDETYGPAGKTMKKLLADGSTEDISLEKSVANINITGGTINGNVYGGGYRSICIFKCFSDC